MAKGHIRKRGRGWQVIVPVGTDAATGRPRYASRTVHGTKREAEQVCAQMLVEAGSGTLSAGSSTVGELLERWYEFKEPDFAPSTAYETRRLIDQRLVPALGDVRLSRLTPSRIDRLYTDLRKSGGHNGKALSASTVRRIHVVLRAALEQAVRWGLVGRNAAAHASPGKVARTTIKPPSPKDVAALLERAAVERPDVLVFLRLAAITGARRGELCALKWSDIDVDKDQLTIRRSITLGKDGPVVRERAKTDGSTRRMSIDVVTVEVLEGHRREMETRAQACHVTLPADCFVFSYEPDCSEPWRPDVVTHAFTRLRDRAGLDHVRLHDLRHYVATRLIAAGVSVRAVSERLGHSNAATTLGIYSHFVEATDQASAQLLAQLIADAEPCAD
jgi:integrase